MNKKRYNCVNWRSNCRKALNGYQDLEEFEKFNERLKKEIEEFQKEQKIGKQKKFQRDVMDFESGKLFDLEGRR